MAKFAYRAVDGVGRKQSGAIEAVNQTEATRLLIGRGVFPSRIRPLRESRLKIDWSGIRGFFRRVRTRDLIIFTKQFRTMLRTGVPMMELLQTLERQTESRRLQAIIASVSVDIKEGSSLHAAFQKHPEAFSHLYCSVIQAGEKSGALPEVLDRLIYIMEHESKIASDVKSALRYPMMVLGILCVAFLILLVFVIPQFVQMFQSRGIILPLPTRICLAIHRFLVSYWPGVVATLLIGSVLVFFYLKTDQGRYVRDHLVLRFPVFGKLIVKSIMSRFASIFSILQYSGVPVLESLKLLSGAIGNQAVSREFEKIRIDISHGSSIAAPLRKARYFTPMMINMVAIGERSENLDELLRDVASHYDSEVEYAMEAISESISPVLTISMAGVVAFFALAIYLPMWDMAQIAR
ncbi:MAG: type II secretion system F family protein [Desulfococcaceae bacterium]